MKAADCKVGLKVKCIKGYMQGNIGTMTESVNDSQGILLGWRIDFGNGNLPWYSLVSIPSYLEEVVEQAKPIAQTKSVDEKKVSSHQQQDINSFQKLYDFFAGVAPGNCKCNTPKEMCPYHRSR